MHGARVLLLGLTAGATLGACSSALAPSNSDAGRDAAGAVDRAWADLASGADRVDGNADGLDGGAVCAPLDMARWPASQCAATWAAVVAYPTCAENPQSQKLRFNCGAYQIITQYGLDSNYSCTYDSATGKLVAVSANSNSAQGCWGPPAGIRTDCGNAITTTVCPADGGLPPDAGAAGCLTAGSLPYFTWNAPCFADAGSLCYADCVAGGGKYVGCVSNGSGARCYASCSECP